MSDRLRTHHIKTARSYTVQELAETVGVSVQSLRNWVRAGLPALRGQKPTLIRGVDAKAWLRERSNKKRKPLLPHEFLCLGCKVPQSPYGGMADCHQQTALTLRLSALCPRCGHKMHRLIALRELGQFQQIFDIQNSGR